MKFILIILGIIGAITTMNAQDILFSPIEFIPKRQYNSVEELYANSDKRFHSTLSNIFLYDQNDSSYIAYFRKGYLQEFLIPANWEFNPAKIISIEFIENNGSNDLLLIKTRFYEANTHSAWTQWFEDKTRWTIINLEYHSIVFDFDVKNTYYEEVYTYSEGISNDSISKEKMSRIIEERQIDVVECGFEYTVTLEKLLIKINCIEPCNKDEDRCESSLKEGVFELIDGVYKRK